MISQEERQKIEREAREILDSFGKQLDMFSEIKDINKETFISYRKEDKPKDCDEDFRERMFKNAHSKNRDCIIAEKAKW